MGKRTKEKSEEYIKRKIRKLERKLKQKSKSPPAMAAVDTSESDEAKENNTNITYVSEEETFGEVDVMTQDQSDFNLEIDKEITDQNQTNPCSEPSKKLPVEILAFLGEAKSSEEKLGANIPIEIAERWGKILLDGLHKEQKEALAGNTLVPENFQMAKAPRLNAEVATVLTESSKNRDKRLERMQNQLGLGIARLTTLTSTLISEDIPKMEVIKNISEANQILLDLHFEQTMNRRRLIIPMLDKSFISVIQGVKRDGYLFGENLGENIKTTKSIEKCSQQIKKPEFVRPSTSRKPNNPSQGNLRAPPRQASGPGAARTPIQARYRAVPPPPGQQAARRLPLGPRRVPQPAANRPQDRRNRY